MKKILLLGLMGLGGVPLAHAQNASNLVALQPAAAADLSPIEAQLRSSAPAARASTVRYYTRSTTYAWNTTTNQWATAASATNLTYNTQGLVTQEVVTDSATQVPSTRATIAYTGANQIASRLEETWAGSQWQNATRYLYSYDGNGRNTEFQIDNWVNGAWVGQRRSVYTYDAAGRRIRTLTQQWTNNAWTIASGTQTTYVLDAQNRIAEQVVENWSPATQSFAPNNRYVYTYSGSSLTYSGYVSQAWVSQAWRNTSQVVNIVYNTKEQPLSYQTQTWDGAAWQPYERTSVEYLATNTVTTSQRFSNGTWVNSSRIDQKYDANGKGYGYTVESWANAAWQLDIGFRYFDVFNSTNDMVRRLQQTVDFQSHAFVNQYKYYYYDFQAFVLASRPAMLAVQPQLYPNPTTHQATLELSGLRAQQPVQVELLNPLGQIVRKFALQPQAGVIREELNLSGLPAGVYSVRLLTADGTAIKRLVKE
ncbi:T9SS type A sorting domain-containing protein [Hymenobacter cellulosivorans]|uniref:T9SS type A sorting domain-containing protein n=1 Tax=Hymenobacter cellulosivorans TaxID=2932249 RepID=A0ABY4FG92_9BACT|nr:T9SS type A sorting domain-containing protein [Hymenobacter cellulosivorans]UOQ54974.1 T9SS type A sorting domain-containing protein [Hymenobacter cellulosivorans]